MIKFKKEFNPEQLSYKKVVFMDFRPNKNKSIIHIHEKTDFGNYRLKKIEAPKALYTSFRGKYKRTFFKNGRKAYIAFYEGVPIDIELLWDQGEYEGIFTESYLKDSVDFLKSSTDFESGWKFDGTYIFKIKQGGIQKIFPGVSLADCHSVNLTTLKGSKFNDSGEFNKRQVLLVENPNETRYRELLCSTTISVFNSRRSSKSSYWFRINANPELIQESYVNLEGAVRLNTVLGNLYGREAASEVDMFRVCLQMKAFPYQIDDSAKILAEYKMEENGNVLSRVDGIKKTLLIALTRITEETDIEKLRKLSRFFSFFSVHGLSHLSRSKRLYINKGQEKLSQPVDLFKQPGIFDSDALSLEDFLRKDQPSLIEGGLEGPEEQDQLDNIELVAG